MCAVLTLDMIRRRGIGAMGDRYGGVVQELGEGLGTNKGYNWRGIWYGVWGLGTEKGCRSLGNRCAVRA